MITLNYVVKNTSKFKKTNTATLYREKSDVYKVIDNRCFLYNEIINHIKYNYEISGAVSSNIILPKDLIVEDEKIRGYKCDYVHGKSLENLAKDLDTNEKIILINKLTDLLKEINQFLVVGDVNLDNCMYDKYGSCYLLDFDLSSKLGESPSMVSLYNLRNDERKDIYSNLSTDKVKMGIVAASILYGIDFEGCFTSRKPYSYWNKFLQYTENSYLKDYFKTSLHSINKNKVVQDYLYLPNTNSFASLIDNDKKRIRKLVK